MKPNLAAWNDADKSVALRAMLACCAARRWAQSMVSHRPFRDIESLS